MSIWPAVWEFDANPPGFFRRRRWWLAGGAVLVAVGLYFAFSGGERTTYDTVKAAHSDMLVTVNAAGTLQPQNQVDVGPEISGRIDRVFVDYNDKVTKGQVLAELDIDQLKAKLAQSQASLSSARAGVRQYEATLAEAKTRATRARALFERNAMARQDVESMEADLLRAQANLEKANADTALAAAQVTSDQTNLSKTSIRSPIDGVVLNRTVQPGQAAASLQTPVLFTLASDLAEMQLQVDIDEADIGSVHEGQNATFTVDAFPQRRFNAKLVSLRNSPKVTNSVVTYQGVLSVDNSARLLRPGLTATAEILVAQIKNALLVPNGALRFTPNENIASRAPPLPAVQNGDSIGRIWVLSGSTPEPRIVHLGRTNGRETEVLSGELKEGDAVITDAKVKARGSS